VNTSAGRRPEPEHVIGMGQRVYQAAHPRRGGRQRPARRPRLQAQVQLALPGCQPLPPGRLQQFHLSRGMRRPQSSISRDPRWEECTICSSSGIRPQRTPRSPPRHQDQHREMAEARSRLSLVDSRHLTLRGILSSIKSDGEGRV
jgi:hypothetical protein